MRKLKKLLVLVHPKEKREVKTESGIIIPDTVTKMTNHRQGIVELVGEKTKEFSMDIKPGDTILYHWKPDLINVDGMELITMNDVLLVL